MSIECVCGGKYKKNTLYHHQKTKKHLTWMESVNNPIPQMKEIKETEITNEIPYETLLLGLLQDLKQTKQQNQTLLDENKKLQKEIEQKSNKQQLIESKPQEEKTYREWYPRYSSQPIVEEIDSGSDDTTIEEMPLIIPSELQIHFSRYFDPQQIQFVHGMIMNLYHHNILFQTECRLHQNKLIIYKNIHCDSKGWYFNGFLQNSIDKLHFYFHDYGIYSITKIQNVFI